MVVLLFNSLINFLNCRGVLLFQHGCGIYFSKGESFGHLTWLLNKKYALVSLEKIKICSTTSANKLL